MVKIVVDTNAEPSIIEHALLIIKPDAMLRGHMRAIVEKVKAFADENDLKIVDQVDYKRVDHRQASDLYREHMHKPFFVTLCLYLASVPVTLLEVEGPVGTIGRLRIFVGSTMVCNAEPGTLRHDFGVWNQNAIHENVIHCSDSPESGDRELAIFGMK